MKNIRNMLKKEGIPIHKYQLSKDSSRIFFFLENEDIPRAIEVFHRVFGIYSFSPALRTSNKIKNIIERTIEVGKEIFKEGDTFALRVKRSGKHDYSSHDVAVKVGQAVNDYFSDLKLKVNLSSPNKRIFLEIRNDFTYLYTDIIKSKWGGLPIESGKKIMAMDVGRLNDLLASFLLMRRGAVIYPVLFTLNKNGEIFEERLTNWKELAKFTPFFSFSVINVNLFSILERISRILIDKNYICAICRLLRFEITSKLLKESKIINFNKIRAISDGIALTNSTYCPDNVDLESISLSYQFSEFPIFTPLIGLDSEEINRFLNNISKNLKNLDYCQFKPKNQEINVKELWNLYKGLNISNLVKELIEKLKKINIS